MKGYRYWTASLLPALAGTALPFWLDPPGFAFKGFAALEFIIGTLLFHQGFIFLKALWTTRSPAAGGKTRVRSCASICLLGGCFLGWHINSRIIFHEGVFNGIFIVYGLSVLFLGILYTIPPFRLSRRPGGEMVLAVGLGMMPLLGAYLVQAGDLTRTVYLASLPLVASTGLWVWTHRLVNRKEDARQGHRTMVMVFPLRFSGRWVTPALTAMIYGSLVMAVFFRSSLPPLSLVFLLTLPLASGVVALSWKGYPDAEKMARARRYAFMIHLACGVIIFAASLAANGTVFLKS